MICFKFYLVRFDIFFKGPQKDRANNLLDIITIKILACPPELFLT